MASTTKIRSIDPPELIGQAPLFLDALAHASMAAALDRPLLICGERGSGKELIAARIHFLSPRWEGPFVKLNCAALAEELLDSELFGHEAGSFTGARSRHAGRFERAEGGTLFLDEIATAGARIQEKLLRVIEYGEYERVGGDKTLIADVRIVAAANVDLKAMAQSGRFRADLLDRLAFDVIAVPPLRRRPEDISLLAAHFAQSLAREIGGAFPGFSPDAMATLTAYGWPGNVRELKNAAERSVYRWLAEGREGPVATVIIDPFQSLLLAPPPTKPPTPEPASSSDFRASLEMLERQLVVEALEKTRWRQTDAAKSLSLTYDQLRGLMKKHALKPPKRADQPPSDRRETNP